MKSYLSLVSISAKTHKGRNRMTQLCIILAVFLISVIFGMVDMQVQSQRLQIIENTGNWHVAFTGIDDPTAVDISGRSVVRAAES